MRKRSHVVSYLRIMFLFGGILLFGEMGYAGSANHLNLKNTCYCLKSAEVATNGKIVISGCNDNDANQDWAFDGELIRVKGTDYCLNTPYRANNGSIFLWPCDPNDPDQKWVRNGETVCVKDTNFCLNTPNRVDNGSVFLWTYDGNDPDQKWVQGSACVAPTPPHLPGARCANAPFIWPTWGKQGWLWRQETGDSTGDSTQDGNTLHDGLDILQINDQENVEPVYAVCNGTLQPFTAWSFLIHCDQISSNFQVPQRDVWVFYTHMGNNSGTVSYVLPEFRPGNTPPRVTQRQLLGYQGRKGTELVHLHISVNTCNSEQCNIDPSPYFGDLLDNNGGKDFSPTWSTPPFNCQVAPSNEESLSCSTWDGDITGCDAHGLRDPNPADDTQDCAYYTCSGQCRPRGTSNCEAGCSAFCSESDETKSCSTWDEDVTGCDAHGLRDPNPADDTQDCAYYSCSDKCRPRGTSNCEAGCSNYCYTARTVSAANGGASATIPNDPELSKLIVSISQLEETTVPPANPGFIRIGQSYAFQAFEQTALQPVTTFNPPISLAFTYDPAMLNGIRAQDLAIHYYDEQVQQWVALPSTVNSSAQTVTGVTTHFTKFALFAPTSVPPFTPVPTNPPGGISSVPEPTTFLLVGVGILGILGLIRRIK